MTEAARRVIPGSGQWHRVRCSLCAGSMKKGQLWMGGRDYMDCPDCEGTGIFKYHEERVQPPPTRVFLVERR
jgi:hypothetical protein